MAEEITEEIAEKVAEEKHPYWRPWPTVGLGCALMAVAMFLSAIIGTFFLVAKLAGRTPADIIKALQGLLTNGLYFSVTTIAQAIVCTGLIIVFINMLHTISFRDYLGLREFSIKKTLVGMGITVGIFLIFDGISLLLGKPIVGEWQKTMYLNSVWPTLLWLALILFGPVFEEALVRGFLFEGFRHSRMGVVGAIIVTTLLWSLSHVQYDIYVVTQILIFGIVLGYIRYRTGSLWTVIAMHSLNNLVAMAETAYVLSR